MIIFARSCNQNDAMAKVKSDNKKYKTLKKIHRIADIWVNKTRAQQATIKRKISIHFAESKFYTILGDPHKQLYDAEAEFLAQVLEVPRPELYKSAKAPQGKKGWVKAEAG